MNKKKIVAIVVLIIAIILIITQSIKKNYANEIYISGTIEATEIRLAFQVGGKITEMLKNEGDTAKTGEIVARIDKEELSKMINQAEASLQEAKFNYERMKEDYNRVENLFQSGAVSAQQRDTLKTNFDAIGKRVDTLQANLDLAKIKLNYTDLVSPINGFITVKSVEIGEIVQIGTTIFTISDLKNIWVTGYIKEPDLGRVKLNQKAKVKTDSYPDKEYIGYVSFISPESEFTPKQIQTKEERINRVYRIKISLDNSNRELKTGMPVDAYIVPEK